VQPINKGTNMNDDYSIEQKSGRWIVWRLSEDRKLRQGSHETYNLAYEAMERSMDIMK